jgi:SAM-dependent methyltransferase
MVVAVIAWVMGVAAAAMYCFPWSVSKEIEPRSMLPWGGHAYAVNISGNLPQVFDALLFAEANGDSERSPYASGLRMYEGSTPFGTPHAVHAQISELGQGRFSHWGHDLVFSTPDNSDPRTNGRRYGFAYPVAPAWWVPLCLFALGSAAFASLRPRPRFMARAVEYRWLLFTIALVLVAAKGAWFFHALLPAPIPSPDSNGYLLWSLIRTIGYPLLLEVFQRVCGDWRQLPWMQAALLLAALGLLAHSVGRLSGRTWLGWLVFAIPFTASGMLLSAADVLTEAPFAAFVMFHAAFMCSFIRTGRKGFALGAGIALLFAILIKSVAVTLLGPLFLFIVFRGEGRRSLLVLTAVPALLGWLGPSAYNYAKFGNFETSVAGGFALGGHVAWAIHPTPGSPYQDDAKVIEEKLKPILAKRPASFASIGDYVVYTTNEYNALLWQGIVPELQNRYPAICKPHHFEHCSWARCDEPCIIRMNRVLLGLSRDAIAAEPRRYAYHVAVHFNAMWTKVFQGPAQLDHGIDARVDDLAAALGSGTYGRFFPTGASLPTQAQRTSALARVDDSPSSRLVALMTLRDPLLAAVVPALNRASEAIFVIALAFSAAVLVAGRLGASAQAACYIALAMNAYFLGSALAQPVLVRYSWPMQGLMTAFVALAAWTVLGCLARARRAALVKFSVERFTSGSRMSQAAHGNHPSPPSGQDTYSSAIVTAHRYIAWILSPFAPYLHGNIVEVGIGHGSYFEALGRKGNYVGIDIDERSIRAAKQRFPEGRFAHADILEAGSVRAALHGEAADAIVCINVLEHIGDDATAVRNLVDALAPDGTLLIGVPALMSLYNDLDRLAGHNRRYRLADFERLLEGQPVTIEKLCYFNPIGGLGWWANKFRHHDSLNSGEVNGQIVLFEKYILPFSRAIDPLTRRFFGQSVICVARRRRVAAG